MKKVNLTKKLSLNKETIAKLNSQQMEFVKGGQVEVDSAIACTVSYFSCLGGCNGSTVKTEELEDAAFGSCCKGSC